MFVTTVERTTKELDKKAIQVAAELELPFIERKRVTVKKMMRKIQDDCLVVGHDLVLYSHQTGQSIFFHPNFAQVRLKRVLKGERDEFLESTQLQFGDRFLDCTLGYASDSILAAYAVGSTGTVVGLEKNKAWSYILQQGLRTYVTDFHELQQSLSLIQCLHQDYRSYLETCPSKSYDVVYFDPMFEQSIEESSGLQGLKHFAFEETLTPETVLHALRVAKKRVVLKAHFRSPLFKELGFSVKVRKTSTFHFGIIEVE